jgi:hypothetical protein
LAETLIDGVKKVKDGDYAIVFSIEPHSDESELNEYYVRKDDTWVIDNKIGDKKFFNTNEELCIAQKDCLYTQMSNELNKEMCSSLELTKDNIVGNALNTILNEFDKKYQISKEELNEKLNKYLEYRSSIIDRLQTIEKSNFYKYNDKFFKMGLENENKREGIVTSPYLGLRDLILGQSDFIKKQNNIVLFKNKFTRMGNSNIPNINDGEMESVDWLYCKETNTKLLPIFYFVLANTFLINPTAYDKVMNIIIKKSGKISDDGDSIVDVNSGM